ncbi:MAG: M20/M25/M40 family metallo-hydrolase [Coriobacteriia bacterium]|nr:M20/M25/M40 family metallo-hydrolase [Coriobacteriia bacterium]
MSRLLETFLDLVRIDSPTGHEREVAEYMAAALEGAGCEVRLDESQAVTGSDTGNLLARLPGTVPGPVIALSAHMDCVQPCEGVEPVIADGVVRPAGATVLGGDDKIGLAVIVETMRRLRESGTPHPEIRAVLTVAEECGLLGAKALTRDECTAEVCLVLDADGEVGGIVTAAPTHYTFKATFSGRAAHAGVEPEKGISAIRMASVAIGAMELGRLDERTTANIGAIVGGSATNVVPPRCDVTGECRSLDRDRVEQARADMDRALRDAAAEHGGEVDVSWNLEYEGFSFELDSAALSLVEGACADIGIEPRCFATGGGSDGNVFAAHGVPTLVLSSGMRKVHSTDEEIEIAQLGRLADLLVAVARRAGG